MTSLSSCLDCFSSRWTSEEETISINSPSSDRKAVPSERSYSRILSNIFATIVLAGSGAILYTEYANKIKNDVRILTSAYLGLGASIRALLEANLPKEWSNVPQTIVSKSFFEAYEVMWNLFLNISNQTGQQSILNLMSAWGSFAVAGDFYHPLKLEVQDRKDRTLADLHLDAESVNPILGPSFDNLRKQIYLKTTLTVVGIGLTIFSYTKKTGFDVLFRSFGFFLSFLGLGFFTAQSATALWQMSEASNRRTGTSQRDGSIRELSGRQMMTEEESTADVENASISSLPKLDSDDELSEMVENRTNIKISRTTKAFRFGAKIITSIGAEALAALYLIDNPYLYIPGGFIYGGIQYLAQRKFQVMTKDIYDSQWQKNMDTTSTYPRVNAALNAYLPSSIAPSVASSVKFFLNIKTALKVEMVASVAFLFTFLGWFSYGADESGYKDRLSVIVLMISYVLTEICAIPVEKYFKPEQNGPIARTINHLRYVFYHHPYLIAMAYLSLLQISEINDESLQLDSLPNYICGLVAVSLFGMNFALHRMRSTSTSNITTFTPPVPMFLFFKTILIDRMKGKFGM